jgi:hypothetical protein
MKQTFSVAIVLLLSSFLMTQRTEKVLVKVRIYIRQIGGGSALNGVSTPTALIAVRG